MESSRRSNDRSKEPGLKKPRLIEETERNRNLNGAVVERDRPFLQRISSDAGAETGSQLSRFKKNQRERNSERDDSVRGAYQQQPPHHELVIQYKTALAELTFNSKPIITNLTIIAGENLHAAKGIAATICANILEVPNEQKLPSLYLLDSIVKNIGRDYIKYFGARLPEVFCKAYRQVDSSIHPSMRHLFGTWKGVFHSAPLQLIEKELGFPPTIVVPSSGRAASRPDSQTQRPAHSIHVNPKYLEARQQLQQSSKVKGTICDSPGTMFKSDDAERPDRIDGIGKGRPWDDPPVKMNNIKHSQGVVLSEPVLDKNIGGGHDTLEYDSGLSRHHQDLGISRASEGVAEQGRDKPRYVAGRNVVEPILGQHIGFDIHHGFPNRLETKSAQDVSHPESTKFISNKSCRGSFANWKDSEEEEFIWDDMNSKVTENGASDNSRRDVWTPDDAEKLELADHISQSQNEHDIGSRVNSSTESLSMSQRVQIMSEQRKSSVWPLQESYFLDGLNRGSIASIDSDKAEGVPTILTGLTTSTSLPSAVIGPQRHRGPSASVSGSVETFEQQRHQPLGPASTSGKSSVLSLRQRSSSPSPIHPQKLTEQEHPQLQSFTSHGPKSSRFAEQLDRVPYLQNIPDSSSILPQSHIQLGNLRIPESNLSEHPQYLPFSSASMPFPQERHHTVFSHQPQSDVKKLSGHTHELSHELSVFGTPQTKGSSTTGHLKKSSAEIQGHSCTTSLLAAISQSGQFSKDPLNSSLPKLNFQELEPLNSIVQPPFPSRHPPAPSSTHKDVPVTPLYPHSYSNSSAFTTQPQIPVLHPQMPPGPPTSSSLMGSMSSQTSNTSTAIKNPLSSLLNSLAAKGLISASTMESPTATPSQVDMNLQNQSPGLSNSSPMLVTSRQVSSSQVDMNLQNQSPGLSNSSPMLVTSRQVSSTIPLSSSGNDLPPSKSIAECITNLSQGSKTETNLIGFEFKPEIIRQSHPSVISGLFHDLPFCCKICGIRFKLQERLDRHLEWHASKKQSSLNETSRRWFVNLGDWSAGHVELPSGPSHPALMEDSINTSEKNEKMVPADESQCVCALCGELFEDFYSHERDEWMFKGAVYLTNFDGESMGGTSDKNSAQGPIVHSNCI